MVPRRGTRRYINPSFKAIYSNVLRPSCFILDKNVVTFVVNLALLWGDPQIKATGGRMRLSLIQMLLLRHLKAGFEKRLTGVANLVTNGGLTALLMNAGAYARSPRPPLHVLLKAGDNSLFRR